MNGLSLLERIPAELLYEIQLFALSSALPQASKHLYLTFKNAPGSFQSQFIFFSISSPLCNSRSLTTSDLYTHALRYPFCSMHTLNLINTYSIASPHILSTPSILPELPKRFFRGLTRRPEPYTEEDYPLPLLKALYENIPSADSGCTSLNPNTSNGYPLAKAVHSNHLPLIRFLLEKGANPKLNDSFAVMVAIRTKSLPLVKLLVERSGMPGESCSPSPNRGGYIPSPYTVTSAGGRSKASFSSEATMTSATAPSPTTTTVLGKRRRISDRVPVTLEMLKLAIKLEAKEIASWLVDEKGLVPDMSSLMGMG